MAARHTTDWDDPEQVEQETNNLLEQYPHLKECASAEGDVCPVCGSSKVELKEPEKHFTKHIRTHRCLECSCGYTRYRTDPARSDDWGPDWKPEVVSYGLEGCPYYVYFHSDTNVLEGIGPEIFPWE